MLRYTRYGPTRSLSTTFRYPWHDAPFLTLHWTLMTDHQTMDGRVDVCRVMFAIGHLFIELGFGHGGTVWHKTPRAWFLEFKYDDTWCEGLGG